MGIEINGRIGPSLAADGALADPRLDRLGSLVVTDAHGRYREASSRGLIFTASNVLAGVAPGTALSATPPIALWNPPSSKVNLSIVKVRQAYVSGTLGSGPLLYAYVPGQSSAPTGGTELTVQATMLNGARGTARAFSGSTLVAVPTLLQPAGTLTPFLATTVSNPAIPSLLEEVAGGFDVPPGAVFVVQAAATAGTTPLVMFGIEWEEVAP